MNEILAKAGWWWLGTAAGGGAVLLLAGLWMRRASDPGSRQRLGEWGVLMALGVAALRLGPAWIPVPTWAKAPEVVVPVCEPAPTADLVVEGVSLAATETPCEPDFLAEEQSSAVPLPINPVGGLLVAYFGCVGFFSLRWLVGQWGLTRLVAAATPVPRSVGRLFEDMVGGRSVRLLESPRIATPICCGVWRPTIVLPRALARSNDLMVLRWVFAHELTHLSRRDPWSSWVLGVAQAIYFYMPWFWWVKRQVRLCQEYVADAAAVAQGPWADEYAQFLVNFARSPAAPLGATGVFENGSDLYRRVSMVLNQSSERRSSRGRLIAGAGCMVAAGVVFSGIGAKAEPPKQVEGHEIRIILADDEKKPEGGKGEKGEKKEVRSRIIMASPLGDAIHGFDHAALEKKLREALKKADMSSEQIDKIIKDVQKGMEMKVKVLTEALPAKAFTGIAVPEGGTFVPHPGASTFAFTPAQGATAGAWTTTKPGGSRFGVMVEPVGSVLADQLDLAKGQGLVVTSVVKGSVAEKAGVKGNDIILKFAGKEIKGEAGGLVKVIEGVATDTEVEAVLLRKGKKEVITGIKLPEVKKPVATSVPATGEFKIKLDGPLSTTALPARIATRVVPGEKSSKSNKQVTITIKDGEFSATEVDGDLTIVVAGMAKGDKVDVSSVTISEPGVKTSYSSVDKVPSKYKAAVEKLIANQSGSAAKWRYEKKDD